MEKDMEKFSDEIIRFSKLTDKVFSNISKDILSLKAEVDKMDPTKELKVVKKSLDELSDANKNIVKLKNDIKALGVKNVKNTRKIEQEVEAQKTVIKEQGRLIYSQSKTINELKKNVENILVKLNMK